MATLAEVDALIVVAEARLFHLRLLRERLASTAADKMLAEIAKAEGEAKKEAGALVVKGEEGAQEAAVRAPGALAHPIKEGGEEAEASRKRAGPGEDPPVKRGRPQILIPEGRCARCFFVGRGVKTSKRCSRLPGQCDNAPLVARGGTASA